MHEALIAQLETELLPGSRANELVCSALRVPYDNVTDRVDYTLNLVNQQTHNAVVSTTGWAHLVPIVPDGEMAEFIEGRREGEPAIALCIALLKLNSEQRAGEAEPGEYDVASDTIRYQGITAGTVTMRTGGPGDAFVLPAAGRSVFTRSAARAYTMAVTTAPATQDPVQQDLIEARMRIEQYRAQADVQATTQLYNPFPLPPVPAEYYGAPDAPMRPPRAARRPTGTNEDYWRPEGERNRVAVPAGFAALAPVRWVDAVTEHYLTENDPTVLPENGDEPNGE